MWWSLAGVVGCRSVGFELDVDLLPGTAEATVVPTAPFELALFDERPDGELPAFLALERFGPALLADRVLESDGDGFVTVAVTDLVFTADAPITLEFAVSSGNGRWHVLGDEGGGTVPASCTTVVDADSTPDDLGRALLACLRDDVVAHGGPDDFHVRVSATTTDDDWELRVTYVLGTDRPTEVACTGPLGLTQDLIEQAGSTDIVIEELSLAGYAASGDVGASVVAFAGTWADGGAPALAGASGRVRVDAGEGAFVGSEVEVGGDVPGSIRFRSGVEPVDVWPAAWADIAMDTLLADGFVDTCDVRVHDALPNRTWLELALVGAGEAVR